MTLPLHKMILAMTTLLMVVIAAFISPLFVQNPQVSNADASRDSTTAMLLASVNTMATESSVVTADAKAKISFSSPAVSSKAKPKPVPPKPKVVEKVAPTTPPVESVTPVSEAPANNPMAASTSIQPISAIKEFAQATLASKGMGDSEFTCLVNLWEKESNWNFQAENPSSGAYGIPQSLPGNKMESIASDWRTNPKTQVLWGISYIEGRYQTPCGAWGHSVSVGWY